VKADKIIEKFALRAPCVIGGKAGQKMDEECIQRFISGDPSGRGKYLEWMLFQAGGGKTKYERALDQWKTGNHGEESVSTQLRHIWIKDAMEGYRDDNGNPVKPVTQAEAEESWKQHEKELRTQHVYGDEDYLAYGGFGFYRSWPGKNSLYELIVKTVGRFHRHQDVLKTQGKSLDLNVKSYPNLSDLLFALKDITANELMRDLDYDVVYRDDYLAVVCPFNIGASLKFGIPKWCTSNESMFISALSGQGTNRWHEYASISALYYFRFKGMAAYGHPVNACAVQMNFEPSDTGLDQRIADAAYWDAEDKSFNLREWLSAMTTNPAVTLDHIASFKSAIKEMKTHFQNFPRDRVVTTFSGV
jgi:hypothetical protein